MDETDEKRPPWTDDERMLPGDGPSGPTWFTSEPGGPIFSKGGEGADAPPPGGRPKQDHPLSDAARLARGEAQEDRRIGTEAVARAENPPGNAPIPLEPAGE